MTTRHWTQPFGLAVFAMADVKDYSLDSYDYELPQELIARFPLEERDSCRLMILRREAPEIAHDFFYNLARRLPKGALLVANDSATYPARIIFRRPGGGKSEFLALTPPSLLTKSAETKAGVAEALAECLLKPAAKIRLGEEIEIAPNFFCEPVKKGAFGKREAILRWRGDLGEIFRKYGETPLPPYLGRKPVDGEPGYQTIYAKKTGSAAAPTAGLHFSENLRRNLAEAGFGWAEVTLHVGYGTFSPVRENDIRAHQMHAEYAEIDAENAQRIIAAKSAGTPIVAVGTTSLRTVEGFFAKTGQIAPASGWIDAFFYPGARFGVFDGLITNFHLPKSSLLMLVSAFVGRDKILAAYAEAIKMGYKFFSYGDAMLILA